MSASRVDQRLFSTIGDFRPSAALSILRGLAEHDWDLLDGSGLIVGETENGLAKIVLPFSAQGGQSSDKKAEAYLKTIILVLEGMDIGVNAATLNALHRKIDPSHFLDPINAAIFLAARCQKAVEDPLTAMELADQQALLAVAFGGEKEAARQLADVLKAARDVVPMIVLGDDGKKLGVASIVNDMAEHLGTFGPYLSRDDKPTEIALCRGWPVGLRRFWAPCPLDQELAPAALLDLSALLDASQAGVRADDAVLDPVFCQIRDGHYISGWVEPEEKAKAAFAEAPDFSPVQPISVTGIRIEGGPKVTDALMKDVAALDPKVGYAVSLRPLRRSVRRGIDTEQLREEIEDLESMIRDAEALEATQMRLLRFSDKQLPAMIDTLRKLPPEALKSDREPHKVVRYAAGYSGGRPAPVHYLLYDPTDHAMDHAEMFWRRASGDDRPMSYWIEPYVAQARQERTSGVSVFVPEGTFLAPSPVYFGDKLLGTLKLMLGDLFHNVSPVVDAPGAEPAFVFTATDPVDRTVELEAIDMRHFEPLQRQLPWINDHLEISDPIEIERSFEERVARTLYATRATERDLEKLQENNLSMRQEWDSSFADLRQNAVNLIEALAAEVIATQSRISSAHHYLSEARKEMREIEALVASAEKTLSGNRAAARVLQEKDLAMREARENFEARVASEIVHGEAELKEIDAEIEKIRDRLAAYDMRDGL